MSRTAATVHVCTTAYRPIERDVTCSVRALCDLLARYAGAIRVYVYTVEGSYLPPSVDEVVACVRRSTVRRASRQHANNWAEAYAEFVPNAHREIVRRATAHDVVVVVVDDDESDANVSALRTRLSEDLVVVEMFGGRFGFSFRRVSSSSSSSQTLVLPFPVPSTSPVVVGARRPNPRRAIVCGDHGADERSETVDAVRLAGYVPHVLDDFRHDRQRREEIRDAAVVVMVSSSTAETVNRRFSSVPYESMALGTPVVLFGPHRDPCVKALLTFDGYPVECSRGEIARALRCVEDDEPALRDACRRRALSFCSANVVAARLLPWVFFGVSSSPPPHRRDCHDRVVVGRVYCVNLRTRRPDRYARMRRVFEHEGFDPDADVTFVDANDVGVDPQGTTCPWTDAETFGNARTKHATFLSHLRTWRRALADWDTHDASHALICEDDLVFAKDWRVRIDELIRNAPQTKLVMLNACARNQDRWIPDRFARAEGCMLTGCYLVSRSLLIRLLDTYSETRPEIADMCLYHVQRTLVDGEGWVFHPMLACQILDSSDIQTPDHQATIVRWTRDHMARWGDRYTLL